MTYMGAVQLLLVLVFFLTKFFALTNSSTLPSSNENEKRDSKTTTISKVMNGSNNKIEFPFVDFVLMRQQALGIKVEKIIRYILMLSSSMSAACLGVSCIDLGFPFVGWVYIAASVLLPFVYISLSNLLVTEQAHLAKVMYSFSKDPEFKEFWASKVKHARLWGKGFGGYFFLGAIGGALNDGNGLMAVGYFVSAFVLVMTLYTIITFLQILTRGHVATIHQLGNKILAALTTERKDRTTEEEIDDAVAEHADMMNFSNKAMAASLHAVVLILVGGVAAMVSLCIILLKSGFPDALVLIFGMIAFAAGGTGFLAVAASFVSLLSSLGQHYNIFLSSLASATMCQASNKAFGDPMAVQSMCSSVERRKEHVWVLFAYPVDDTLVWGTLTYLGAALLFTFC